MSHRHLVLAVFADEAAADRAVVALKQSDIAHGDAIGILVLDAHGKLKQEKVGARSAGEGAAIGGVLILLGPAAMGIGVFAGAMAGSLHHRSLGLSDDDKARLKDEITAGKAAVGVLADIEAAPAIAEFLTEVGGAPTTHELSDEAVDAAAADAASV